MTAVTKSEFAVLLDVYQPMFSKQGFTRLQQSEIACTFSNRKGKNVRLELEKASYKIHCEYSHYDKLTEVTTSLSRRGYPNEIRMFLTSIWEKL